MKLHALAVIFCLLIAAPAALAEPLSREQVPEPLRPWTDWVLRGHEDQLCPVVQNPGNEHRCLWPSRLSLTVNETSARFTQNFRVFHETFAMLPGDQTRWPLDVHVDGKPAPATIHNGMPAVYLKAGSHVVEGSFAWDQMLQIIPVPPETGLLALNVDGKPVDFPHREPNGLLWLRSAKAQAAPEGLEVEVQRRVVDDVPLLLVTRIELNVSGKDREVTLGKALPEGFIPMTLQSPLPARVEPDGHLRVQLRPGTWTLELTARHEDPATMLSMPATDAPWAVQEVWAFEAHNDLRVVSVEGVNAIDPNQTRLAPEWRQFPTFLMQPGKVMRLVEKRRGDSDAAPDQLSLSRKLWLDFNGGGFTVQDDVTGIMNKNWRLEMTPDQQLGRVAIAGADQVIPRRDSSPQTGVEIRQGQLEMQADSRINGGISRIPAVGWDHDFQSVSATLWLPPGWRLFRASGVDDVSTSWITDWTLLDLFLVLFITMVVYRMWGAAWGSVALLTLALTYLEAGAPRWIWLALLAGEALYLILPKGRATWVIQAYRLAAAVTFVVIAIPFMIDQVRVAIYPALQAEPTVMSLISGAATGQGGTENLAATGEMSETASEAPAPEQQELPSVSMMATPALSVSAAQRKSPVYSYANIDPNATITTGPGLPRWNWRTVNLSWRGPVERSQQIRLWMLSPAVNFLLGFLRVGLIVLLAFRVFISMRTISRPLSPPAASVAAILALIVLAPLLATPVRAADFPPHDLLNELQRRLLEKHDCSPECGSIPRMQIEVTPSSLVARIGVDAAVDIAIPLPGSSNGFTPSRATLDGKDAEAIIRTQDGLLWLLVPAGAHQVLVEGALPDLDSLEIPLPLKPHRVEAAAQGWTVEGIREDGVPDDNLRLVRQARAGQASAALQPGQLPPFVHITRVIHLGLEWQVDTEVQRVTDADTPITLQVPLLPGESVTSPGFRADNGMVGVSMPPSTELVDWHSTLKIAPSLELKAPNSLAWTEVWRLFAAPMWHVEPAGIPQIYLNPAQTALRIRQWQPWPGESVMLNVTRPEGISGPTLTIDSSRLETSPGLRATDVTVTLDVRSSRGGQKTLVLPAQAELQSLAINGNPQPIRQEKQTVTIPIVPGRQSIAISWREPHGVGLRVTTPAFDPGAASVNADTIINMPADRWTLFVAPALLGPAVLFWGLLLVFAIVAVALGRSVLTPLRAYHWLLLSFGLTQVPVWWAALIVGWLLALGWRKRQGTSLGQWAFRAFQILLAAWTLAALAGLFGAIEAGLLGLPQMQISGNGSTANQLQWFHDRVAGALPQMWAISVPLMVYRLAMLLWALWLASALLSWLRWGWSCFSQGGLWRTSTQAQPSASPTPGA